MRFTTKVIDNQKKNRKEIWVGELDSTSKYNGLSIVNLLQEGQPGQLFFGETKDNNFDGFGFKYFSDDKDNMYIGMFNKGEETFGIKLNQNSLRLTNFFTHQENDFIISPFGDWAYIEKAPSDNRNYLRGIRYLKNKRYVEFIAVNNGDNVWAETLKSRPIGVESYLRGMKIYQNLYGCKFDHYSYNSVAGRLDDFVSENGKLNSGESWEDCAQKVNNESQGVGAIKWSEGNYYIGEWNQGWREGFGMHRIVGEQKYRFSNYRRGKEFGDLMIEYLIKQNTFMIYLKNTNTHIYFTAKNQIKEQSIFGICNDQLGVSVDIFHDFSFGLFAKKNSEWMEITRKEYSVDRPINNNAPFENVFIDGGNEENAPDFIKDILNSLLGGGELNDKRQRNIGQNDSNANNSYQPPVDAEKELNELIGLEKVKEKVELFKASAKKRRGKVNLNFAFVGNPGTGKTVVARLFSQILFDSGLLPTANLIEVSRSDLVGAYIGETEKKTSEVIQRAMGGTLFIDEAYSLNVEGGSGGDYGKKAVEILLKTMEDHRGELCIILAGYSKEMHGFFDMNSGFKSRIPMMNYIEFENYNEAELRLIAKKMIKEDPDIDNITDEAFEELMRLILRDAYKKNFDNARCVRNVINAVLEKQILRTREDINNHDIIIDDVRAVSDPIKKDNQVSAEERLNNLVGLTKVKKQVIALKNTVKKFKSKPDRLNLHMVFLGNPGTGKTEVAKLIGEIYYDEGILPTKNIIMVDPSGLISQYLGETSIKTHDVVQRALGGVLFIDEAYALMNGDKRDGANSYGAQAIEALLQDMEEYRGKFCVILAGYTNEMLEMIKTNPGFKSRIPDHNYVNFPDYNPDELIEIAKLMVKQEGYTMSDDAYDELKKIIAIAQKRENFENARFVRNVLQGIESFQNTRTVDNSTNMDIILDDVLAYEKEEEIITEEEKEKERCISEEELLSLPEINGPVTSNFIIERSVSIHTETKKGAGEGTGFIISPNGYIVTNNHVIDEGTDITVGLNYLLANGQSILVNEKAKVIATNKDNDVAIIKIDRGEEKLPYFTLNKSGDGDPQLLTDVIMGGYPLGKSRFHQITLTTGKVQSINKDERIEGNMKRIYLDLSGTHGNSGSAVIDVKTAKVIGIFSGASVDRNANAEINFAIPTEYIWDLIKKVSEKDA